MTSQIKTKIENISDLRKIPLGSKITFLDEYNYGPGESPTWRTLTIKTFSELLDDGEIYFYINDNTFLIDDDGVINDPEIFLIIDPQ